MFKHSVEKINLIKQKLIKTKFLFGIPLAFFSLEIYFGVILGYFAAKFFSGKERGLPGKINFGVFDIGNWRIHFHHWLCGLGILISLLFINLPVPQFFFGIFGGVIFQGIYCYSDWHKVIIKQKNI